MKKTLLLSTAVLSASVVAQDMPEKETASEYIEQVTIIGSRADLQKLAGSATLIDKDAIAKFDASDLNNLISQVPGVYVRFEDGYGLRPNIGIRGVTSDRSQKITLMEDGILISPAPYSAPAAYYFPNVNRLARLEVVKGPSAILHGPHTIGGAINMVTDAVPQNQEGELALSLGSDNFQKLRAKIGNTVGQWGYSLDALRYSADGFKELDNGDDTGFVRNDINAKLRWTSNNSELPQSLTLKLGYADEVSDETYLGLTDSDFDQNPNRRYSASALDQFTSEHSQVHLLHTIELANELTVSSTLYWHLFDRAWFKFDRFIGNDIPAQAVLADPALFPNRFGLLNGTVNSDGNPNLTLALTNNDRTYGSYGASSDITLPFDFAGADNQLTAGIRFHHDYVERRHSLSGYFSQNSQLVFDGVTDRPMDALNEARTNALALYIQHKIAWEKLELTLGLRYENIRGEFDDFLDNTSSTLDNTSNNTQSERSQDVVMPGIGAHYALTPALGLIAGINRGFSPAGPSSTSDVNPETAINYEYGFRYAKNSFNLDAIGFYSDYDNLLGRCRASDFNCNVGDEFNGGEVDVSGVEITSQYIATLNSFSVPLSLVYTYTESAFQTSFDSSFSQWGRVFAGDELPYLPQNQLRFEAGLEASNWRINFATKFTDESREVPGLGSIAPRERIDALTTFDVSGTWQVSNDIELQLIGENITDKQQNISRRPFGARPSQPRIIKAGIRYQF